MTRYQSNFPRTLSPWWIRGLIAVGVVGLLVGVLANAAQAAVLNPDYYQDVLDDEQAYERAYAELSRDPSLLGVSSDLMGGAELPFVDQIPGLLINAIPVQLVEAQVDKAIEDLIAYLKKHKELQLTLDITPFIDGAGSPGLQAAIDLLGGAGGDGAPRIPDDFEDGIGDILDDEGIDGIFDDIGSGDRTPLIPLPRNRQNMAPGLATEPSPALALRTDGAAPVDLSADAAPGLVLDLRSSKFVREVVVDGETHYVVGPPQRIVDKVDSALFMVQLISANSYWLRPVGIAMFIVALGALAWLSRTDRVAMARRLGLVLLIGGLVGGIGWLIALPIFQNLVIDSAFEGGTVPSEAFDDLARDVLKRTVSNISPYIWLPTLILAGIGGALVVLAKTVLPGRGRTQPAGTSR